MRRPFKLRTATTHNSLNSFQFANLVIFTPFLTLSESTEDFVDQISIPAKSYYRGFYCC